MSTGTADTTSVLQEAERRTVMAVLAERVQEMSPSIKRVLFCDSVRNRSSLWPQVWARGQRAQ